jgi:hypothetical protein
VSNIYSEHADAVLALLNARPELADKVHDAVVPPKTVPPYVLVHMHRERPKGADGNNLGGESSQITYRAICHCIGRDAAAARAMAYQVEAALLDVTPEIVGRECGQVGLESAQSPGTNQETGVPVVDEIDTYRFVSHPA